MAMLASGGAFSMSKAGLKLFKLPFCVNNLGKDAEQRSGSESKTRPGDISRVK